MTICMSGCGNSTTVTQLSTDTAYETQPSQEQQTGSENITEPNTEEQRSDEAAEKVLQLKIADTVVEVDWEYTRLGHITDQDTAEMEELLGNGDVTITVSMEDNK